MSRCTTPLARAESGIVPSPRQVEQAPSLEARSVSLTAGPAKTAPLAAHDASPFDAQSATGMKSLFSFRHEDCGCQRGHCSRPCLGVQCRLSACRIAGISLHRMKMQRQTLQPAIRESHRCIGCVEEHHYVFVNSVVSSICIQLHDNQAGRLIWTSVEEGKVLLHFIERRHVEQS